MSDSSESLLAGSVTESDVAIVGMSGRFPGAPDVDALWARTASGDDCLTNMTEAALLAAGVDPDALTSEDYVRRSGIIDGVDRFDAGFFGISPRDAAVMDPQHRHFLECVWEAIESAGYAPEKFKGSIGLFGGCGANTYLLNNLLSNPQLVRDLGWFLLRHTGNDKDFLTTGVSYRLDLRGPSVNVQTACSTSLVALHLAAQSLLAFECDMAVAGGVTIEVPHGVGYLYRDGEILSPEGHCRAFDASSDGTVLTSGVAVVALRRATEAIRDGDCVLAVIKGSAINNDGARKVGYLAPSIDGHADVVREALAVAGVDARSITLIDAHGTGTAVGDPIEFTALTEAFRGYTADDGFCRITSTKPNIGHLDTAAGTASLIKVIQALRHRYLPPLANHTRPSPLLELAGSPFVISGEGRHWDSAGPRRAGVSSLGVGGTNVHVIVEEAPPVPEQPHAPGPHLIALSARSEAALDRVGSRLADHLSANPDLSLADVAFTLSVGRRDHAHRRVVVATDVADAIMQLRTEDRRRSYRAVATDPAPSVGFMFPGGGAQYAGMAAGLGPRFEEFHRTLSEGLDVLSASGGEDLRPLLAPGADPVALQRAVTSLPAVFAVSTALARQWQAWGVSAAVVLGHSLGEYVAAHLAGVLSFEEALRLVLARATLMDRVGGSNFAMLVTPLPEDELRPLLTLGLALAAVNAADECVVSGPAHAIGALEDLLSARGVQGSRIPLNAAAHSSVLDPILADFAMVMRNAELRAPTMRYPSNLTGTWITAEQATDPRYWVDHLRGTVRFDDDLATVLADGPCVLVELGPGHTLSSYARRQPNAPVAAIPALRHQNDPTDDSIHALGAIGRVWAHGVPIDLSRVIGAGTRRRLRLPTYPFERERYWIEPGNGGITRTDGTAGGQPTGVVSSPVPERIADMEDWCWESAWEELLDALRSAPVAPGPWMVVADDDDPIANAIVTELTRRGESASLVSSVDAAARRAPRAVCVVGPRDRGPAVEHFGLARNRLLIDAMAVARLLGAADEPRHLAVVTRGALGVDGPAGRPAEALALGPVCVGPEEYPELQATLVDLGDGDVDIVGLVDELSTSDQRVALRGSRRLAPCLKRRSLNAVGPESSPFKSGGVYIVTGALGGIGHVIAHHLLADLHCNVVAVSSAPLPDGDDRAHFLATHGVGHPVARRIVRLQELENLGGKIVQLHCDLADPVAVERLIDSAEGLLGRIDGVVHAAGQIRDRPIDTTTERDVDRVIGAKALGALVIAQQLARRGVGLLVLVGSTSTELAPAGQCTYLAANAVIDAMAGESGPVRIHTIDFGVWAGVGMAAEAARRARLEIQEGEPVEHPVLSARWIERDGTITYVGRLDQHRDWIVDEHRLHSGTALLPGTGHLELMLSALRLAELPTAVEAMSLLDPLLVADDRGVTVRVTIAPESGGVRRVRIESDRGGGSEWSIHSEAQLAHWAPAAPPPDLERIDARCLDDCEPLAGPSHHLRLGSRWSVLRSAKRGGDELIARLGLCAELEAEASTWRAHPGLVDVATVCGIALGEQRPERLFVPVSYGIVRSFGPLIGDVTVIARRRPATTADMLHVDLMLLAVGGVCLIIEDLALRSVPEPDRLAAHGTGHDLETSSSLPSLLEVAERLGIRESEGVELFDRVLATRVPRLIVSSVDLDALRAVSEPPSRHDTTATRTEDDDAQGSTGLVGLLIAAYSDLLGVSPVGPDDDFFELGGHSLIAIRLLSRVHKATGVRLQLATLFEASTATRLADVLVAEKPELATWGSSVGAHQAGSVSSTTPAPTRPAGGRSMRHSSLVPIRDSGDQAPLFLVHGGGGNVLNLWGLAKHLPPGRPLYGLQAHGINAGEIADSTVGAMADRYLEAVRTVQPRGPHLLGGYSGGGVVALEMSRRLAAAGDPVTCVILLDTVPRVSMLPRPWRRYLNVIVNAVRVGPRSVVPWFQYSLAFRRHTDNFDIEGLGLGFGETSDFGLVNLAEHFSQVINEYEFVTYDVDVLLIKAQKVYPVWPWHYMWKGRVKGRIDTAIIPGDHFEMFAPSQAPKLASDIAAYLDLKGRPT